MWERGQVETALRRLNTDGLSGTEAVKEVAKVSHRPRADVYRIWLSMEDE